VDPLLGALSDGDASVRVAAAWALGRIEDRRAVTPLTRLLLDDADAGVRRAAAEALGDILG
jgi:HEAT repeat protein